MKYVLLVLYAITINLYCYFALRNREKSLSRIELFLAIVLPIGASLGALGYLFAQENSILAWCYVPVFVIAVIAVVDELFDIRNAEGGVNVPNVIVGVILCYIFFGIGLTAGFFWLKAALGF